MLRAAIVLALCCVRTVLGTQPVDAALLLREANAALLKTGVMTFSAESQGSGALGMAEPTVRGRVTIENLKLGKPELWHLAIRGVVSAQDPALTGKFESYVVPGDTMVFRHAVSEIYTGRNADASGVLEEGGRELVWWLIEWHRVINPALAGGAAKPSHVGQRSVAGEMCDVIRVDSSALDDVETDSWWYLSTTDRLPRRVDRLIQTDQGGGIVSLSISGLKVDEIDPAEFRLEYPLDYAHRDYTPSAVNARFRPRARGPLAPGSLVPDFQLATPTGQQRLLSDVRERVVVLAFWASWSKSCLQMLTRLGPVHARCSDKPVTFWALSTGDHGEPLERFNELKLGFEMLQDADPVAKRLAIGDLPVLVVIGTDGRVISIIRGGGEADMKTLTDAVQRGLDAKIPEGSPK